MLGNATEWCFDEYDDYPLQMDKVFDDMPPTQPVEATGHRVMRGGAFITRPRFVRSALRDNNEPATRFNSVGLRPARTYR